MEDDTHTELKSLPLLARFKILIDVLHQGINDIYRGGETLTKDEEDTMRRHYQSIVSWQFSPLVKVNPARERLEKSRKDLEKLAESASGEKARAAYSLLRAQTELFEG